jgi:hypothetical protein
VILRPAKSGPSAIQTLRIPSTDCTHANRAPVGAATSSVGKGDAMSASIVTL